MSKFKVINYDVDGKLIPDLSEILLPERMNRIILTILLQMQTKEVITSEAD